MLRAIFFFRQTLAGNFFFQNPPSPPGNWDEGEKNKQAFTRRVFLCRFLLFDHAEIGVRARNKFSAQSESDKQTKPHGNAGYVGYRHVGEGNDRRHTKRFHWQNDHIFSQSQNSFYSWLKIRTILQKTELNRTPLPVDCLRLAHYTYNIHNLKVLLTYTKRKQLVSTRFVIAAVVRRIARIAILLFRRKRKHSKSRVSLRTLVAKL